MKTIPSTRTLWIALIGGLAFSTASAQEPPARVASAKPGEVRVFVSGGLSAPIEAVRAQAQAAVGKPLVIEYGTSRSLQTQIESGQPFEVALLTKDVYEAMLAKGKLLPGRAIELARARPAIGQRGPAPPRDVSTPEATKATLLGAKAIRYFQVGSPVPSIEKMFAGLDVAAQLQDRILLLGTPQPVRDPELDPGEYELFLTLPSEIMRATSGWTYLGVIPEAFQMPIVFVAGVGAQGDPTPARALIEFLQGPTIEPVLKSLGMTR